MLAVTDSHESIMAVVKTYQSTALLLFKPVGGHGIVGPVASVISVIVLAVMAERVSRGDLTAAWYIGPIVIGWISVFSAAATAGGQAPGSAIFNSMLGMSDEMTVQAVQTLDGAAGTGFFAVGTDKITGAALPWRNLAEKEFSAQLSSKASSLVRTFTQECASDALIADLEAGNDGKTVLETTPIRIGGVPTNCHSFMTDPTSGVDTALSSWKTTAGISNFGGLRAVGQEMLPVLGEESSEVSLLAKGRVADELGYERLSRLLDVSSEKMGEYIAGWTGVMAFLYFVWLFFLFTPWIFPATAAYFALLFAGRAQIWGFYLLHVYDKTVQLTDPTDAVTVLNALKLYYLKLSGTMLDTHMAYEARHLSALAFESKAILGVPILTAGLFVLLFVVVPRVRRAR